MFASVASFRCGESRARKSRVGKPVAGCLVALGLCVLSLLASPASAAPTASAAAKGIAATPTCADASQQDLPLHTLRDALTACFRQHGGHLRVDGGEIDRGTALHRLHEEPDPDRRRALFAAFGPLWRALDGDGAASSPYRRLMALEAAHAAREGTPLDRAATQLGVPSAQVEAWLEQVLAAWRKTLPATPVEPWDYRYLNSYANRALEKSVPADALLKVTRQYFRDLGADPETLEVQYDLAPSPGKSPLAYTDIRRPGATLPNGRWQRPAAVVVGLYPEGGLFALNELVHETGHAVHVAALHPPDGKTDWPDTLFVEAFADVPSWNTHEPAWQQQYLGASVADALAQRALLSDVMLDLAWALFEIRLLRNPALDPNLVWTDLTARYLNIRPHPEMPWWAQRVQLVEAPGYMLNYGLGAVITAELRAAITSAVGDFRTANLQWYPWVEEHLLHHGPERSVRELLHGVLGRPLSASALLAQVVRCATAPAPLNLRVMTFNVWYGGDQVSLAATAEAIQRSNADVIGIQEPEGHLSTLAAMAGYPYVDRRRNLLSRYPLFESDNGQRDLPGEPPLGITALDPDALHVWVMVRPGEVVAVANTHLPSDLYGPEAVRDGAMPDAVMALEQEARVPSALALRAVAEVAREGTPLFLTGDFNTPSHRDWVTAMQHVRPDAVRYPFAWPSSNILEEAGLRDSFREVHPDPTAVPGLTWTAGMPAPYIRPAETQDRIDFIWTAGQSRSVASHVVGEPGGVGVAWSVTPWPSDHRALVSDFEVVPVPAPAMIAVEPSVIDAGEEIHVRAHDPNSEGWNVVVVRAETAVGAQGPRPLRATHEEVTAWRRFARFSSQGLPTGEYDAVLLDAKGEELKRTRFAIVERRLPPRIELAARNSRAGKPLALHWENMPGNRFDWVGVFRVEEASPTGAVAQPVVQRYLQARTIGKLELPTIKNDKPLPAGLYEVRLMLDDSTTVLASTTVQLR